MFQGKTYLSKLEAFFARKLTEAGIEFQYEPETHTIFPGFKFNNENIRPIQYTPDFVGEGWIVELKGYPNDSWPLRLKMWKKYMLDNNITSEYLILRNQRDCLKFIDALQNE